MIDSFPRWALTALAGASLLACGGGGGGSEPTSTVSGSIVKGPVASASVCAYELAASGKGKQLGCTTSNADGSYSLKLNYTGDILVEATGGIYTDEVSGAPNVALSAPLTVVGSIGPGAHVLIATPLTALAVNRAVAGGGLTVAKFESNAVEVGTAFGLPADIKLAQSMPVVSGARNAYGNALITVSQALGAGGTLAGVTNSNLVSLGGATQLLGSSLCGGGLKLAQVAEAPSDAGVYMEDDGSPAELGLNFHISSPASSWRALLPQSGPAMGCKVLGNSALAVDMMCPPSALMGGVRIIVSGSEEPVPSALPATGVLLAGNRIDGAGNLTLAGVNFSISSPLTRIGDIQLPVIGSGAPVTITSGTSGLISTGTTISTGTGVTKLGDINTTASSPSGGITGIILNNAGSISVQGGSCKVQTSS